jgi:phosphatidylinositol kinase/protein kinase (PI-3  family)
MWCLSSNFINYFEVCEESVFRQVFLRKEIHQTEFCAEEKLEEISARLEHSPCKSLAQLAQQCGEQVQSSACRHTKLGTLK